MAKSKAQKNRPGRASPEPTLTTSYTENKYYVYGMLLVFLVLVFLASSYKVSGDDDFFWHLATGRFVVENKYVPDKDIFGYVTSGDEWIPFEWGWDVLTYGLYNIAGYNTILVFRSIMFCLIFFIYFMLLRRFKINSIISIVVLFTLLVAVIDRLSPRPHIVTYVFFVTLLYILLTFRYLNREKYFKRLYFLPLIFLVWGNVHMGVLAGGLLLFIFTVSEIIQYYLPNKFKAGEVRALNKKELQRLFIISALCALVLLINPHGLQTYLYAYEHTKMKMLETVNEWQKPFSSKLDFGFVVTLYKVFLFGGIIVLIYAFVKRDLFFGLVYIGFLIYSVRAIRFTVDYEIILAFFIAYSINYFIIRQAAKSVSFKKVIYGNPIKVIIWLFFVYIISQIPSNNIYQSLQYYRVFGWGINDEFIPVQLFDFKKENDISGNPYNHFGTGGYLVWNFPGEKNFIDSRNLNDKIFTEYNLIMSMRPGFERKLDDYGVDYVIYLDPDLIRRPNELKALVPSYLSRNANWKLVFWDDKSMLFLRNIPKFTDVINKYEYKVLNPYNAIFYQKEFESNIKNNPDTAKEEMRRKAETEPNGFLFKGMREIASKWLLK